MAKHITPIEQQQTYRLFLFTPKKRVVSQNPHTVNGVSLEAIAPEIIRKIESFPLGTIEAVLVYDETEFVARFTIKDYLNNNIPKRVVV